MHSTKPAKFFIVHHKQNGFAGRSLQTNG